MKVFLCWSGQRSKAVAETLYDWLPKVIQAVKPWISTEMDKGVRWQSEIGKQLENTKVGIVCLTRDNLQAPWIHFESGALAKTRDARVCTFLLDVKLSAVKGGPLAQFQHTEATNKKDVKRLLHTINERLESASEKPLENATLDLMFEKLWPELHLKLQRIVALGTSSLLPLPIMLPTGSYR